MTHEDILNEVDRRVTAQMVQYLVDTAKCKWVLMRDDEYHPISKYPTSYHNWRNCTCDICKGRQDDAFGSLFMDGFDADDTENQIIEYRGQKAVDKFGELNKFHGGELTHWSRHVDPITYEPILRFNPKPLTGWELE